MAEIANRRLYYDVRQCMSISYLHAPAPETQTKATESLCWLWSCAKTCFTMVVVGLNITSSNLANYLPPGEYETLTPDEIKNAVYGSKWVMITEEFQLATLWLTKVCLLILYLQMTWVYSSGTQCVPSLLGSLHARFQKKCWLLWSISSGLPKQHRLVKWVLGYAAFGWVVSEIFYLGVWCRPIQQYWQVPVQNCTLISL